MRVLAINDISCVGKCSLTVALPIISASGVTCDILPTAILSTHTGGFKGYTFRDLSEDIPAMIAHWKSLGLQYDIIISGYLGSIDQIEMVKSVKRDLLKEGGKMIVDPVMGDNGITSYPYVGSNMKSGTYRPHLAEAKGLVYTDDGSRLSVRLEGSSNTCHVVDTYDQFPFAFENCCFHLIDDVL